MRFLVSLESAPGLATSHVVADVTRALAETAGLAGDGLSVRPDDRTLLLDAALPERDAISAARAGVRLFAEALERAGLQPEIDRARVVQLAA